MPSDSRSASPLAPRTPKGRTPLTSLDLPFLRSLLEREGRERTRLFFADGIRNVIAAQEAGRSLRAIVVCKELLRGREGWTALHRTQAPFLWVTEEEFRSLTARQEPQGIGVVAEQRWDRLVALDLRPSDLWVVLDGPRTPGNLGTILRTCAAVGAQGVMLIGGEADPHDPSAVRASMGAIFGQRLVRTSAKALEGWRKRHPCRVIGTSPSARTHYRDASYRGPLLLLMGGERQGLRERQIALCDEVVRIPMPGRIDSLNLAVATGVVLYEALEQRDSAPQGRPP